MGIFGRKNEPAQSPVDLRTSPDYIRVYDQFGREMYVEKAKWRSEILPVNLKKNWDNPDVLYSNIVAAMQDGFFADVLKATERLYDIDPISDRAACAYAIVLTKLNHLEDAERVLNSFLQKHGENATVLINLAKVYSARSQSEKSESTLWHALELDPNMENGFAWYLAIHRERGGDKSSLEAMHRIAALSGSWRAQLWLARSALDAKDLPAALAFYRDAFSHAKTPIPAHLLMQVSGDLGQRGFLAEAIELTAPHFQADVHGLVVGNNLVKAYLDLGNTSEARLLLDRLYALQRPDWKENLNFWDTEIAKAEVQKSAVPQDTPIQATGLITAGPVWLKPDSPAVSLFAPPMVGPRLALIGSTVERFDAPSNVKLQLADKAGRLSRALPFFLAEQIAFHCGVSAQTVTPWLNQLPGGFIVSGRPWSPEHAIRYVTGSSEFEYLIICHLKLDKNAAKAELRVVRVRDHQVIATMDNDFSMQAMQEGIPQLASKLVAVTAELTRTPVRASELYKPVLGEDFSSYMLRLEQLLAVRVAGLDNVGPEFLHGVREILQGNIELCVAHPENIVVRLILAQTALSLRRVRPDVLFEFKDKLLLIQEQKPLRGEAQAILQRLISEAVAQS